MERVKIHLLTIAALVISAISMSLYAYRNFKEGETGYGIVFIILCLFLAGLVIRSLIRNRTIKSEKKHESFGSK